MNETARGARLTQQWKDEGTDIRRLRRRIKARSGFALVIVIWALGLITFLILNFTSAARLRTQVAINLSGGARAEELADAAIRIVILDHLLAERPGRGGSERFAANGNSAICSLPTGAVAAISIEDESGKIDLNAAPATLIQTVLGGLSVDSPRAHQIAASIVAYRSTSGRAPLSDGPADEKSSNAYGPKNAPFQTIFELDQVSGMTPETFALLSSLVTVFSRRSNINLAAAPPPLLAVLSGSDNPGGAASAADLGIYDIRTEVVTTDKSHFVREAIVDFRGTGESGTLAIREWRQGVARYRRLLDTTFASKNILVPPC